jgi:crotonobetainyl-CoA:carnitine CoA-transferase CaiB-like acyl-CoA transferase
VEPLAGFRVVDFSQLIAGPSASAMLADLGATVTKIESPKGDPARGLRRAGAPVEDSSPTYRAYNKGKRSIVVDLKSPEGIEIVRRLIRESDVLIEAFLPGVMDRLGLGSEAAHAINPSLVYASLAGFGFGEVGRTRRGVDLVIQAESGLMSVTGYRDSPPTKVGFTIVDAAAGHVLTEAILAALLRRERTAGTPANVRVSLLDVALHLQAGPITEYLETGQVPARVGNSAPTSAPADLLSTKDGYIVVSAYIERHWQSLCRILGTEYMLDDDRFSTLVGRLANRDEMCEHLERGLASETSSVWLERFAADGVVAGAVKDYDELVVSPEVRESSVLPAYGAAGSGEPNAGVRAPFWLSGSETPRHDPAPVAGQDTRAVLHDLGYADGEIDELLQRGAVTASEV